MASTIQASVVRVARRAPFPASSTQVFGSLFNGQLGAAARIVALRRSSSQLACRGALEGSAFWARIDGLWSHVRGAATQAAAG